MVNATAKIHLQDPQQDNHAIVIDSPPIIIPLQLNGIFSFFHTRKPTKDEIDGNDTITFTPEGASWDPYSEHFSSNEESIVDHEGNIVDTRFRKKHCLGTKSVSSGSMDTYDKVVDT